MTKKCTGQNPPGTASAKPGELWGGKGKRAPYSTWHYETNHKTRHALHQGKHYTRQESCPPDLSQNNSIPFTNVEIRVPGESGPPDALHSPRSTRCRGAVGLPFISPIIKPLGKEWAKPWMFPAWLVVRAELCICPLCTGGHTPMSILQQKHQQQCVTGFAPHRETLKYGIHSFPVIPLNQG